MFHISLMIRNRILDRNSECSSKMLFDNAPQKLALAGIAFISKASNMVPQISAEFVRNKRLLSICILISIFLC